MTCVVGLLFTLLPLLLHARVFAWLRRAQLLARSASYAILSVMRRLATVLLTAAITVLTQAVMCVCECEVCCQLLYLIKHGSMVAAAPPRGLRGLRATTELAERRDSS